LLEGAQKMQDESAVSARIAARHRKKKKEGVRLYEKARRAANGQE